MQLDNNNLTSSCARNLGKHWSTIYDGKSMNCFQRWNNRYRKRSWTLEYL